MSFTPIVIGSGLAGWTILNRSRETQQAAFDKSPQIAGDVKTFKERISKIDTADQLLDDRRLLRVALGAFGLDADIDNRAFIKKVLESDPADDSSFANRLSDKRYLSLSKTFGFAGSEGPQVAGSSLTAELKDRLSSVKTPDDLLSNRALLTFTLKSFGLESGANNSFFLKTVLGSDPSDPDAIVNRLSNKNYLKMVEAIDFTGRNAPEAGLSGFLTEFNAASGKLATVDDFLANDRLVSATLDVFGLESSNEAFLRDVMTSDWTDSSSFVNQLQDKRYKSMSAAFNFGGPAAGETRAEAFAAALTGKLDSLTDPKLIVYDFKLRTPVENFFGLEEAMVGYNTDILGKRTFLERVLNSDPTDPKSLTGFNPDKRYYAVSRAFGFNMPEDSERTYPEGFADELTRRYAERQFEIGVGEVDQSMRIALSLEREIGRIAESGASASAQWYTVMSNPPLRQAFETVFNFPSSFGSLDVDQQLTRFMERSERVFGTSSVADFAAPDKLDELTRRFLTFSAIGDSQASSSSGSAVLAILSAGR